MVKFILSQLNMNEHFNNPNIFDTDKFSKICLAKLKDVIAEQWHSQLTGTSNDPNSTNKLRFYKLFKTSFNREKYLELIPDFQLRRCIKKFRCSDHRLEIKLGCHNNTKVNERAHM